MLREVGYPVIWGRRRDVRYASRTLKSQNCDMLEALPWKFKVYVTESGRPDVQSDIDRLTIQGRQFFAAQVRYLASTAERSDWHEPEFKKLKGAQHIYEIRFKNINVQTRALGYFEDDARCFVITLIATHKQNVYSPTEAIKTSATRKASILAKIAGTAPLKIDGEEYPPVEE